MEGGAGERRAEAGGGPTEGRPCFILLLLTVQLLWVELEFLQNQRFPWWYFIRWPVWFSLRPIFAAACGTSRRTWRRDERRLRTVYWD